LLMLSSMLKKGQTEAINWVRTVSQSKKGSSPLGGGALEGGSHTTFRNKRGRYETHKTSVWGINKSRGNAMGGKGMIFFEPTTKHTQEGAGGGRQTRFFWSY